MCVFCKKNHLPIHPIFDEIIANDNLESEKIIYFMKTIEDELRRRGDSSNEPDKYSIGHRDNQDVEDLWGAIQTDLRQNTDFEEIFTKYLENDNVDRKTWLGAP